jgi:hypothetical protein
MCKSALLKVASVPSSGSTTRALLWVNSKQLNKSWPGEATLQILHQTYGFQISMIFKNVVYITLYSEKIISFKNVFFNIYIQTHIYEGKQLALSLRKLYWITGRKSQLSLENLLHAINSDCVV